MTKHFGLIGKTLNHSYSQYIADDYFNSFGIDADYSLYEIEAPDKIFDVIAEHPNLNGLNVTSPYKTSIMSYLDVIDETAATIGAVNCVSVVRGNNYDNDSSFSLKGFNTDYAAFEDVVMTVKKDNHRRALILGTGGASKAVAYAFDDISVPYLFVSRTKRDDKTIMYEDLSELDFNVFNIIVNATPCGTVGFKDSMPDRFPFNRIESGSLLLDLVYNPSITPFLKEGIDRGCFVENGMRMLTRQAELFYKRVLFGDF